MFWFGVNPRKVISRGSETPRTSLEINGRLKVFLNYLRAFNMFPYSPFIIWFQKRKKYCPTDNTKLNKLNFRCHNTKKVVINIVSKTASLQLKEFRAVFMATWISAEYAGIS